MQSRMCSAQLPGNISFHEAAITECLENYNRAVLKPQVCAYYIENGKGRTILAIIHEIIHTVSQPYGSPATVKLRRFHIRANSRLRRVKIHISTNGILVEKHDRLSPWIAMDLITNILKQPYLRRKDTIVRGIREEAWLGRRWGVY